MGPIFQILIFISFFILWEVASRARWIDPLIFSSPVKVWNMLVDNVWDGSIFPIYGQRYLKRFLVLSLALFWEPSWRPFYGGHLSYPKCSTLISSC